MTTATAASNTLPHPAAAPAIGEPFAGGFYAGRINIGADTFALILSPAAGALKGAWNKSTTRVEGAEYFADGLANTLSMFAAGSTLATKALALDINGLTDWYIPSRDELELIYRHFKPTDWENYADGLDGVNAHSVPLGVAYADADPTQTTIAAFQEGGNEALAEAWYWSSTQYAASPSYAWFQNFDGGYQFSTRKTYEGRARAVRRLKI